MLIRFMLKREINRNDVIKLVAFHTTKNTRFGRKLVLERSISVSGVLKFNFLKKISGDKIYKIQPTIMLNVWTMNDNISCIETAILTITIAKFMCVCE